METLRQCRENLQKIYGKNDYWMVPIFRSLFSMTFLFFLSQYLQMTGKLGNPMVILSLGLLSFFLPFSFVPCLSGIFLLYYFYTQSILLLGVGALFFVFIFIIQSSVRGKYAILIAAMPLCFFFRIPYFLPLLMGLTMGLSAVISLDLGILVYYFLRYIREYKDKFSTGGDLVEQLDAFSGNLAPFIKNKELFLVLLLFTLAALAILVIRNFSFNYSFETALAIGLCLEATAFILYPAVGMKMNLTGELLSFLLSALLSIVALFFWHDADYRGTEFVQFEDDAYYYHVKAVPKKKA